MKRRYKLLIGIGSSILFAIGFMIRSGEGHSVEKGNISFLGRAERALYDTPRIAIVVSTSPTVILPVALYGEELRMSYRPFGDYSYRGERWANEGRLWGLGQGFAFWWPFVFLRKRQENCDASSEVNDDEQIPVPNSETQDRTVFDSAIDKCND